MGLGRMLLDVLDRVEQVKPESFLAPIPDANTIRLFSVQKGIPFWFSIGEFDRTPGWYMVKPVYGQIAILGGEAQAIQYLEYLDQLPRFFVIALYAISEHAIMVVPFNQGDANQRGWLHGTPRIMHLTRGHSILPFSIVIAREMAGVLLYDSPSVGWPGGANYSSSLWENLQEFGDTFPGYDGAYPGNFRNAWHIVCDEWKRREEDRLKAERDAKLATTQGQIEHRLAIGGASLLNWREAGDTYRITWEFEGQSYTQTFTKDLRLSVAGICLAGGDRDQDLTSIVPIMQQWRNR